MKRFAKISAFSVALFLILLAIFHQPVQRFLSSRLFPIVAAPSTSAAAEQKQHTLSVGDYVVYGQYRQEAILWRVIANDDDKPLLFSEYILCFKAFDAQAETPVGSSDWKTSSLRRWLNSAVADEMLYAKEAGFLSSENFSQAETALLVPNEDGDAVFLLNETQMKQHIPSDARRKSPTQTAANSMDSRYFQLRSAAWYWTSSPIHTNQSSVCAVTYTGSLYKALATDSLVGVCPAMRLNTQTVFAAGDGSPASPYYIFAGGMA